MYKYGHLCCMHMFIWLHNLRSHNSSQELKVSVGVLTTYKCNKLQKFLKTVICFLFGNFPASQC